MKGNSFAVEREVFLEWKLVKEIDAAFERLERGEIPQPTYCFWSLQSPTVEECVVWPADTYYDYFKLVRG